MLTDDFFANLLDISTTWKAATAAEDAFKGRDRTLGEIKWTGTRVDLICDSSSQLRAVVEVYGCRDSKERLVHDFVAATASIRPNVFRGGVTLKMVVRSGKGALIERCASVQNSSLRNCPPPKSGVPP